MAFRHAAARLWVPEVMVPLYELPGAARLRKVSLLGSAGLGILREEPPINASKCYIICTSLSKAFLALSRSALAISK